MFGAGGHDRGVGLPGGRGEVGEGRR